MSYAIGLDIGTNSVGWSVTNKSNQLIKCKGKKMWGVRLFEEGQTAAVARVKRSQRRRYLRRRRRIRLLQELMAEMILPKDPNFIIRLEESFLCKEDKHITTDTTLFADPDYTDSDFYREYPSIYHLRNKLIESDEQADPRCIYLALHHLLKYRGNFLYEGQRFKVADNDMAEQMEELMSLLEEVNTEIELKAMPTKEIINCLENTRLRKKEKESEMSDCLERSGLDKKTAKEIAKAILGYRFDVSVLMGDKSLVGEDDKPLNAAFSEKGYEEKVTEIQEKLQERFEVIERLYKLYSQYMLGSMLKGKKYISQAMIEKYNKHKDDLRILKQLVRKADAIQSANQATDDKKDYTMYRMFFRSEVEPGKEEGKKKKTDYLKNYVNYIKGDKRCSQEELYKTIKKVLQEIPSDDSDYQYCLKEMEEFNFLSRLNTRENSVIPWQLNQTEMERIINQQSKYYPVLEKNKDKIMSLISFRIPYYVGPLVKGEKNRFSWIERTEEKIYPWNFFEVVDEGKTAEAFISKMTSYCTYLPQEKVIPKQSLLYSRFMVLNELNNITIDGKRLEAEDKKLIINELFSHYKRITNQRFCDWLKKVQWNGKSSFEVKGYQKENEFASSLESTVDFSNILQRTPNKSEEIMIEEIIYWLTVFEEKSIVEKKIRGKYSDVLNEKEIKKIMRLRYKGWSKLSRRLLTGLSVKQDEESYNIMYFLENTKMNLMQIIESKELGFKKLIEEERQAICQDKITEKEISNLQGSPAIKRGVWQTVQIVEEIIKCMGEQPEYIMLEVARENQTSQRTFSRKNKLDKAFEKLKEETDEYNDSIISELKTNVKRLEMEKVFLYFSQNGKCLYTGKPLHLDELEKYQVDHIIPQCYIKDDSIENKALVYLMENQRKGSDLLLSPEVRTSERKAWWSKLYKSGLIGEKKYNNLIREGLSEAEQRGFISRQLIETRQVCKHIANLFKDYYVNSEVVLVKAQLSSLFREKYQLYKNRNINDLHHAQDAYLAAVIGNTLLLNHECDSAEWIYNDYVKYFKKKKQGRYEKQGYVLAMFDRVLTDGQGNIVWNAAQSLQEVLKVFSYKNCLVTKKVEEGTGQFYDETIYGREDGQSNLIPLKEQMDVGKYGGYSGVKNAYCVAASYKNKKKVEKRLIGIPVKVAYDIKAKKITLEEYLENQGYQEVKILRRKVMKYQLMEIEKELFYVTSYQEVCNARQLILNKSQQQLVYWMNKQKMKELEGKEEVVDKFYEELMDKIKHYYKSYQSVWTMIEEKIDFSSLTLLDKSILILEILRITKADAQNANLKRVNKKLSERAGRKQKSINLEGVTFINQSVTGLFERRKTF